MFNKIPIITHDFTKINVSNRKVVALPDRFDKKKKKYDKIMDEREQGATAKELGLDTPRQWEVLNVGGIEKHFLTFNAARIIASQVGESPNQPDHIDIATVASKQLLDQNNQPATVRLVACWPGSQHGQLILYEEWKPEEFEQREINTKGRAFGDFYESAEDAWEALVQEHHFSLPPLG